MRKYDWVQLGLTGDASSSQTELLCDLYDRAAEFLLNDVIYTESNLSKSVDTVIFPAIYRIVVKYHFEDIDIRHLIFTLGEAYQKFLDSVKDISISHLDLEAEMIDGFCKGYAFNSKISNMKNTIYEDAFMEEKDKDYFNREILAFIAELKSRWVPNTKTESGYGYHGSNKGDEIEYTLYFDEFRCEWTTKDIAFEGYVFKEIKKYLNHD